MTRLARPLQRRTRPAGVLAMALAVVQVGCSGGAPKPPSNSVVYVDQGAQWDKQSREDYYTWNQGSLLIPYAWLLALRAADGQPFLADGLARYDMLPMEGRKLPAGLSLVTDQSGVGQVGLTCAACHTRQIQVAGVSYRIDGAPASFHAELFTKELDAALQAVADDSAGLQAFYDEVVDWSVQLGEPAPAAFATFEAQFKGQQKAKHQIVSSALPNSDMWGVGRIDALNQIFNRLGGVDLAVPPAALVPQAIVPAVVPVRPPFLWNAPKQDYTQWASTSANGNDQQALMRNVGEVIGVGGVFKPVQDATKPDGIDFLKVLSINFAGIEYLESLVKKMGPPRWPWKLDPARVSEGKVLFEAECASCHGIRPGEPRPPSTEPTWATTLSNVGTDVTYYNTLGRTAPTGVLSAVLGPEAPLNDILNYVTIKINEQRTPGINLIPKGRDVVFGSYEGRVLEGIWAAAPYLHNGSVPTLDDLLKPAAERPTVFYVGPNYDNEKVGLAPTQPQRPGYEYRTSVTGNGNGGHEFGTTLSAQQRAALLEYLKAL